VELIHAGQRYKRFGGNSCLPKGRAGRTQLCKGEGQDEVGRTEGTKLMRREPTLYSGPCRTI
jgi:hypothetical protein